MVYLFCVGSWRFKMIKMLLLPWERCDTVIIKCGKLFTQLWTKTHGKVLSWGIKEGEYRLLWVKYYCNTKIKFTAVRMLCSFVLHLALYPHLIFFSFNAEKTKFKSSMCSGRTRNQFSAPTPFSSRFHSLKREFNLNKEGETWHLCSKQTQSPNCKMKHCRHLILYWHKFSVVFPQGSSSH